MQVLDLEERLSAVLSDAKAPKGNIKTDLKVAIYAVLAIFNVSEKYLKTHSLSFLTNYLDKVGYEGDFDFDLEKILNYAEEFIASKALIKVDNGIYVRESSFLQKEVEFNNCRIEQDNLGCQQKFITIEGQEFKLISSEVLFTSDIFEAIICLDKAMAIFLRFVKKVDKILAYLSLHKNASALDTILPLDPRVRHLKFKLHKNELTQKATNGEIAVILVDRSPDSDLTYHCRIHEIVKNIGSTSAKIFAAIMSHNIPHIWPKNLLASLKKVPDKVDVKDWKGRVDLRDLPLVTIDGEDARDFDDAVYAYKENDHFILYVAIADVSYYVKKGTLLDKEAVNRCNSVYFPHYVVPMLPEKLSNGICSLNPNEDRLCMVCKMKISKSGEINEYEFMPAVMRSHARFTYTDAWALISEGKCPKEECNALKTEILALYDLYKVLKNAREKRGGISVESEEIHFIFDDKMQIAGLEELVRNDAHKLIEECMIAANVAAASYVISRNSQTLYRVHAKPQANKVDALNKFLSRFGLSTLGVDGPSSQDYARLAKLIENNPNRKILSEMILRSMSKAEYSPDNIGHFGLALEKYAHFTSPIRRYPDLQLHRVIKYLLEKEKVRSWGKIGARAYTKAELSELGQKCTEREIEAANAEFDVDNELKIEYVSKFIGQEVWGTISTCVSFGAFVHLDDFYVDGMIAVQSLPFYMSYDSQNQALVSSQLSLVPGKRFKVIIVGCDVAEHKIDLVLVKYASKSLLKNLKLESEKQANERNIIAKTQKTSDLLSTDEILKVINSNLDDKKLETISMQDVKSIQNEKLPIKNKVKDIKNASPKTQSVILKKDDGAKKKVKSTKRKSNAKNKDNKE